MKFTVRAETVWLGGLELSGIGEYAKGTDIWPTLRGIHKYNMAAGWEVSAEKFSLGDVLAM